MLRCVHKYYTTSVSTAGDCRAAELRFKAHTSQPLALQGSGMETVGDVMTYKKVFFVRPDTTIDEGGLYV